MAWVKCSDWKPPIGVYVEGHDSVHGMRHIACLCEEEYDLFNEGSKVYIWRDVFYNPVWPQYWRVLSESPIYINDEE